MIRVSRLNGSEFVLNAEMIRTVEATPDTTIRLSGGETLIVRESVDEVVARAVEYGQLLRGLIPMS